MEKILNKLLKMPYLVLAVSIIITALFFLKMKDNSRMETNLDKYMPHDHPAFVYSDQAACIVTHETVSVYRKNMFIMNKKSFTIVECIMRFVLV